MTLAATCDHPVRALRTGTVPPVGGDEWSPEPLDHVWIACAACGALLRSAPYADALTARAALGAPPALRSTPHRKGPPDEHRPRRPHRR